MLSIVQHHIENDNILVFSSLLFLLPAWYAFLNRIFYLAFLSFLASCISSYNWYYYSIRKGSLCIDIIVARGCFAIYFVSGYTYIEPNSLLFNVGLMNSVNCLGCYYISWNCEKLIHDRVFHFLFHLYAMVGKMLVIYGICESYSEMKCICDN